MNGSGTLTINQHEYDALVFNSLLLQRSQLAAGLGMSFDGKRDLYEAVGYKKELTFQDYWNKYTRQDIAARIVKYPAQETWRKPPAIRDGTGDAAKDDTPFCKAWNDLVRRLRVWHHFERLDTLAGIGRYGVLLIGAAGDKPLREPLEPMKLAGADNVLFLTPYTEESAQVETLVSDTSNSRFNLPETYKVKLTTPQSGKARSVRPEVVHWTRLIHVAEDLDEDDVYGTPRLRAIFNQLDNLEKIVAAAAEAGWNVADRGLKGTIDKDFEVDDARWEAMETQMEEYRHKLRKTLMMHGGDVASLGSDMVDPRPTFETCISLISGQTGIPQRILLGSERGNLASGQDAANWAAIVDARQQSYAEPTILRPFIDRLIWLGALPEPEGGEYQVGAVGEDGMTHWPAIFELNDIERADVRLKDAQAAREFTNAGMALPFALRAVGWTQEDADEYSRADILDGIEQ